METIDASELDKVFAEQIEKHDEARVWQERFYVTLCSEVPPEAVENPLRARDCHMDPVLYHGDRGYQMRCLPHGMGRGFIKIVPSSCFGVRWMYYRFVPMKSMEPVIWLWPLLRKFGDEIISAHFWAPSAATTAATASTPSASSTACRCPARYSSRPRRRPGSRRPFCTSTARPWRSTPTASRSSSTPRR